MLLTAVHWSAIVPILRIITNYSVHSSTANGGNDNASRAEIFLLGNKAINY
jgi:hypothetical protein